MEVEIKLSDKAITYGTVLGDQKLEWSYRATFKNTAAYGQTARYENDKLRITWIGKTKSKRVRIEKKVDKTFVLITNDAEFVTDQITTKQNYNLVLTPRAFLVEDIPVYIDTLDPSFAPDEFRNNPSENDEDIVKFMLSSRSPPVVDFQPVTIKTGGVIENDSDMFDDDNFFDSQDGKITTSGFMGDTAETQHIVKSAGVYSLVSLQPAEIGDIFIGDDTLHQYVLKHSKRTKNNEIEVRSALQCALYWLKTNYKTEISPGVYPGQIISDMYGRLYRYAFTINGQFVVWDHRISVLQPKGLVAYDTCDFQHRMITITKTPDIPFESKMAFMTAALNAVPLNRLGVMCCYVLNTDIPDSMSTWMTVPFSNCVFVAARFLLDENQNTFVKDENSKRYIRRVSKYYKYWKKVTEAIKRVKEIPSIERLYNYNERDLFLEFCDNTINHVERSQSFTAKNPLHMEQISYVSEPHFNEWTELYPWNEENSNVKNPETAVRSLGKVVRDFWLPKIKIKKVPKTKDDYTFSYNGEEFQKSRLPNNNGKTFRRYQLSDGKKFRWKKIISEGFNDDNSLYNTTEHWGNHVFWIINHTCDIVYAKIFHNGLQQIMEEGDGDMEKAAKTRHIPPGTFRAFCKKTLQCFIDHGLVMPDFKPENIAYFDTVDGPVIRVIDVEAIMIPQPGKEIFSNGTYPLLYTGNNTYDSPATALLNTWYSVIVSMIFYEMWFNDSSFRDNNDVLYGKVLDYMTELMNYKKGRGKKYNKNGPAGEDVRNKLFTVVGRRSKRDDNTVPTNMSDVPRHPLLKLLNLTLPEPNLEKDKTNLSNELVTIINGFFNSVKNITYASLKEKSDYRYDVIKEMVKESISAM